MIIQYLIDWTHIHRCIDTARDDVHIERLRVSLSDLRKAIETNGILVKDNSGNVLIPLNNLKRFVGDLTDEADGPYSYLVRELGNWLTLYENRERGIEIDDATSDENLCLMKCVHAWSEHLRRIAPQGINGFVVITDRVAEEISEVETSFFTCETIDGYEDSAMAKLQSEWAKPMTFNKDNETNFKDYISAFAAATEGEVTVADPYWATIALPEYESENILAEYESEAQQTKKRWSVSTKRFIEPFLSNSLIKTISFLSLFPKEMDDTSKKRRDCLCLSTGTIKETFQGTQFRRRSSLEIHVILIDVDKKEHDFHDRYIVGDTYAMILPRGLDVCNQSGRFDHEFRVIPDMNATTHEAYSSSSLVKLFKLCHIIGYKKRSIKDEEIDIPYPYKLEIRSTPNPNVTLSF